MQKNICAYRKNPYIRQKQLYGTIKNAYSPYMPTYNEIQLKSAYIRTESLFSRYHCKQFNETVFHKLYIFRHYLHFGYCLQIVYYDRIVITDCTILHFGYYQKNITDRYSLHSVICEQKYTDSYNYPKSKEKIIIYELLYHHAVNNKLYFIYWILQKVEISHTAQFIEKR